MKKAPPCLSAIVCVVAGFFAYATVAAGNTPPGGGMSVSFTIADEGAAAASGAAGVGANVDATENTGAQAAASIAVSPEQRTARARAFIARYLGTWEGTSTVYLLQGSRSQNLSVHVVYRRSREDPQVISGQAVFAAGDQMVHAASRFFVDGGDIFCEVEFQGKRDLYQGNLAANGDSITWTKAGSVMMLGASSKDTFTVLADGKIELVFEGFENLDNQQTTLTQKTRLLRTAQ